MQNLYQFGHAICVCTDIMIQVTIANHVDSGYARDVHLHHPVNSYYVGFPAPNPASMKGADRPPNQMECALRSIRYRPACLRHCASA